MIHCMFKEARNTFASNEILLAVESQLEQYLIQSFRCDADAIRVVITQSEFDIVSVGVTIDLADYSNPESFIKRLRDGLDSTLSSSKLAEQEISQSLENAVDLIKRYLLTELRRLDFLDKDDVLNDVKIELTKKRDLIIRLTMIPALQRAESSLTKPVEQLVSKYQQIQHLRNQYLQGETEANNSMIKFLEMELKPIIQERITGLFSQDRSPLKSVSAFDVLVQFDAKISPDFGSFLRITITILKNIPRNVFTGQTGLEYDSRRELENQINNCVEAEIIASMMSCNDRFPQVRLSTNLSMVCGNQPLLSWEFSSSIRIEN